MSNEASWTQLGAPLTATLHKPRVHLSDLHNDHKLWLNTLAFCKEEITILALAERIRARPGGENVTGRSGADQKNIKSAFHSNQRRGGECTPPACSGGTKTRQEAS